MKVEIWSDFVCPFCYIGKRKFEAALQSFTHKAAVKVMYKSFELSPDAKRDGNPDVHTYLAAKYGMSRDQALENTKHIAQQAKMVGLDFYFERTIQTNTFDAHRLAHYAAQQGKGIEMTERLLKAHFTDALHLGNHEILAKLASEVGLDRSAVLRALSADDFADDVRQDEQEAAQLGARGVPFFVINRKYGISGAQSSEVFLNALQKAWEEEQPLTVIGDATDEAVCTDTGCFIPKNEEHS